MPQKGETEKGSQNKTSDFRRPFCATAYFSFFRLCLLLCFLFNVVAIVLLGVSRWKMPTMRTLWTPGNGGRVTNYILEVPPGM
jgi:hypothetical protein